MRRHELQDESTVSLENLLDRFLSANLTQIATPEVLTKHLARRTRELRAQIAATLTDENSDIYRMFLAFKELLLDYANPRRLRRYVRANSRVWSLCGTMYTSQWNKFLKTSLHTLHFPSQTHSCTNFSNRVASRNLEENVTYIVDDIANLLANVPTEMLRTAFVAPSPF